jgi:hypothetical protein
MDTLLKRTKFLKLAVAGLAASVAAGLVLLGYEKFQDAEDRAH